MRWFLSKVNFDSYAENKNVNETYVINALSFSEAEAVLLRFLADKGSAVNVKTMKPMCYENVLPDKNLPDGKWFQAKVQSSDGDASMTFLVQAPNIESAIKRTKSQLRDYSEDLAVNKAEETKIISILSLSNNVVI